MLHLAYYAAADSYELKFEATAGKGYADCVMFPKKKNAPGIVIELKYNQSTVSAMRRIQEKQYYKAFEGKTKEVILVVVNYDKKTKKHHCEMDIINL